jgi:hypothetical protein
MRLHGELPQMNWRPSWILAEVAADFLRYPLPFLMGCSKN